MRVVVAGGGIGGLTAALSLHAAGITDVTVLEAAPEIRPLGVGINLLPHSVRELTELGLADRLAELGVRTGELAYFSRHGQGIWSEPRGVAAGYRWPQFSVHRGRLQMMLLDAVRERLGEAAVRTGAAVESYEDTATGARVRLADGGHVDADLLIAADGIRSAIRRQLFPSEGPPPWNGLVLWRGTTRVQAPAFLGGRTMIMAGDGTEKFVAYPLTDTPDEAGTVLLNWIAERPLETPPPAPGDWNRPADPAEILRHFGDWAFDWLDIPGVIAAADAVFEYPMVDRDPLPQWTYGRVTLLGDAAHAMYPIGSNGASQAILDARVLAHALATHASIEDALAAYEADRRPATTAIQTANRGLGPEVVMRTVHERAPEGFTDIDEVLSLAEREEVAAAYKRTAGFDPETLNTRASYDATWPGAQSAGSAASADAAQGGAA
ncbi:flavin-dependent oxidoreductase [Yinghuangia seranimata]|uniref:flavin-dependent oxidoreductase n=1 Tax=Yinghuangia seranimata TaxID=408067 RepID=UPI00248BE0CE|nr:flavin-dependent oxidoreductase [Yinghuangia seranimata]MDI2132164.1 flavin-dependent oxidoreductase [Yinghuangia seranimata]